LTIFIPTFLGAAAMVDQTLIDNIKNRFQQGEKSDQIKEALINEGWSVGDIEAAFAQIRHEALLQIPIYARIHHWIQQTDQKTAQLSTRTIIQIFIGIGVLFIAGVAGLYFVLDPLGLQTSARDRTREDNGVALREALAHYNQDNQTYPKSLDQLVPKYIETVPHDPKSKQPYSYKTTSGYANYAFCINFEMQPVRCISSDNSSDIPTAEDIMQPTDTPVPPINQFQVNGQVYNDENDNKQQDADEEVLAGIPLKILDDKLITICDVNTDTSGIYSCKLPDKGTYSIQVTPPRGMVSELGNPITFSLPNPNNAQPTIQTIFIGLK
jgi:hypothetical protein